MATEQVIDIGEEGAQSLRSLADCGHPEILALAWGVTSVLLGLKREGAALDLPILQDVEVDLIKKLYSGLVCLFVESAKVDASRKLVAGYLREKCGVPELQAEVVAEVFESEKGALRKELGKSGDYSSIARLKGVDWRLEYRVTGGEEKGGEGQDRKPSRRDILYHVVLKTGNEWEGGEADGKTVFVCSVEQLQDLVSTLKDACKAVERVVCQGYIDLDLAIDMAQEIRASVGYQIDEQDLKERVNDVPKLQDSKPWKVRKNFLHAGSSANDIEIYESKVVPVGVRDLEMTSPETGYLRICCQDDGEFYIPTHVVECFECVDIILHGDAVFKENLEHMVRFPDIRTEVMESLLRFVFIEHLNSVKLTKYWGHEVPRQVFQFEVEPDQVMNLIQAAHFLGINSLLIVAATMVAHHLADIPDVSSIAPDLAWCVAEQLTAQQLFDAEQRPDFLSLSLDTSKLWERHCKRLQIDDLVEPVKASNYPAYDTWGSAVGPPPTSWKSFYVSNYLQQLADRQDGDKNDEFFAEVAYKGKFAYNHTVRGMMWEWVLSAPRSLSLASYARVFPNIFSLILVKLPLDKPLADGTLPCMSLGYIIRDLPLLQHLDVSESGVTSDAALCLSEGLQSHTRLQVLRIAYNNIKTEGFSAIAMCLPEVKTLKLLDVRGNCIQSSLAQEVVAAVEVSSLEELLYEGNCTPSGGKMPHFQHSGHSRHTITFRPPESLVRHTAILRRSERLVTPIESVEAASGPTFILQMTLWTSLPKNLKRLQLAECQLTDSHVTTLTRALSNHRAIEILELNDNRITSAGACAIFTWLQSNHSLRELLLGNNNITDSSSSDLIDALGAHPRLEKISLKGNFSYGEENLRMVIQAAVSLGEKLLKLQQKRFTLDLAMTDVAFSTRARILRETANLSEIYLYI